MLSLPPIVLQGRPYGFFVSLGGDFPHYLPAGLDV